MILADIESSFPVSVLYVDIHVFLEYHLKDIFVAEFSCSVKGWASTGDEVEIDGLFFKNFLDKVDIFQVYGKLNG